MQLSPSGHVDTFCRDHLPPDDQWPDLVLDLPELQYPDRLNAGVALLDDVAATHGGDRPCLHAPGSATWTYDDLRAAANRIAHVLTEDLGVVPGNRVLLRGPNNPWLVACWFGALKAGAVAVATMPLLRARELTTIHEISEVSVALCDHRFLDDLTAASLGVPVLAFGGDADDDLVRRAAGKPDTVEAVDTAADDVAMLAFTSGTTGRPKATMHFHRDLLAIADTFSAHLLRPTADDVFTGTPPLAFTFGLGALVVFPLRVGASTLLVEKATPPELAELIDEFGVTVVSTAPTAYKAMIGAGKADHLRGLRAAVSAGEHLPQATWEAFRDATGVRIIDGIGSTEILHIFVSAAGDDIRPGSTGVAVPGYVATVLDDDGREAPVDIPGRLAIKGPTGCRYLADERQRVYVQDGWNITGDTFRKDADGYFWYEARSDDMIVSSGYNIAAPEVEEGVLAHPDVVECGVVGVPDEDRGMLVKAFVVLRPGIEADDVKVKEIQDFTKRQIAPYKYPRSVEFVDVLPRTATGKLQRYRLRDR
ncbi:MAG: AMP-binding protein [Nocardioidaceae bacterium]|nr:AMP-binding protein [Nocardioidaceae bacterium]NUS51848.1 AMP-binding protein [Nocardioidaceae bacterium]